MTTAFAASASLPPQKSSTERQLELTLNAIARSMRKAIRLAEKQDPTGIAGLWKAVEHRAGMLETMLKAAAEYMRGSAPAQTEDSPAEDDIAPTATPTEKSAKPALQREKKVQNPAQAPRAKSATATTVASMPTKRPILTKTSGNGWRLAA